MNKFLLAIALLCVSAFAQPDDDDYTYWPRSYFASIGFSAIANRGDLLTRNLKIQDKDDETETVHFPSAKILVSPDYNLGVNIREFSFALSFQYWSMNSEILDVPEDMNEQKMKYWRFGIEATYNFYYPEKFQVGVGLGYSFSRLSTEKNVTSSKGIFNSDLNGSGIALVTNMRYYIVENFCLTPSLRVYENWFKAINTKNSGTVEFHDISTSYFWQTYIAISINAMVQF